MKAAELTLHRPRTVDEAVRILADRGDDAKVIAGGQSLLPIMNMRFAEPSDLIDITGIAALRHCQDRGHHVDYGATVTHMMLEHQLVPDAAGGLLSHAAAGIGYRAIRNRGTLGGSLAHCDSSAEWPTVMVALDAGVTATSVRGSRTIAVSDLLLGFFTTSLDSDEIITEVRVPRVPGGRMWALHKTNRKVGEFAESLAVGTFAVGDDATIVDPRLWLGAARDVPVRLSATEDAVTGRPVGALSPGDLIGPVAADIAASPDTSDLAERHRLQLHAVTVHRALRGARKADSDD
ncbi:FAD binding domain-containing protein [Mycobacterium sp. NPDC003449]